MKQFPPIYPFLAVIMGSGYARLDLVNSSEDSVGFFPQHFSGPSWFALRLVGERCASTCVPALAIRPRNGSSISHRARHRLCHPHIPGLLRDEPVECGEQRVEVRRAFKPHQGIGGRFERG